MQKLKMIGGGARKKVPKVARYERVYDSRICSQL
jgi:hypothetical protein